MGTLSVLTPPGQLWVSMSSTSTTEGQLQCHQLTYITYISLA